MNELFNKDKLLIIFEYLNERLRENQLQLEITVYGGSIMTMVYDNRPATKGIDCVLSDVNHSLLENILQEVKFTFGLNDDWLNEDIKEPLKSLIKEDKEVYRVYSNFKILKPNAEQLLAMKILAARPEPAKDFVDAFILCKELGIRNKADLFNIISNYVPLKLIGERQIKFIKYLGEDLGYDWE